MVAVVAGVVTALLLSATLAEGAANPWRSLFAETRGAAVWLRLAPGADVAALARLPGVTGLAGPYRTAAATLVRGPEKAPVQLWAMRPAMPAIGRELVQQGHWLSPARPSGVVLEASFGQALHARPGSALVIEGLDGSSVPAVVAGLASTSDQGFYPDQSPGLMWALPGLVHRVEPVGGHTHEVVGLRLAHPGADGFVVQQAVTLLGSGAVTGVSTWQQVARTRAGTDPLLGLVLALFGLGALGGAMLAIGNAAAGRVLVQRRDLAMLKTLGFTPGQVVTIVVAEHAGLGAAGAGAGVVAARLLAGPLLARVPLGPLTSVAPLPAGWVLAVAGGTEAAVLLAAAVPALRAGRVWPVAAVRPADPPSRLSRLAQAAVATRLPPAVVLGARAAFTRGLPAALAIAGLALPVAMVTIGLSGWATLDRVQAHPGQIGLAAALTVSPGELPPSRAERILATDPQVAARYRWVTVTALLPGENSAITTIGAGTSARPYPFHVAAGRLYHAPGEAVASQGLLDAVHLRVGQYIRLPVGGVPVIFHIVGRIIEPSYDGQVLAYGLDTLSQAGAVAPPVSYSLVLRRGVTAAAAAAWLARASAGRLDVVPVSDPAAGLGIVRPMLAGLFVVLGLVALTSLLTASAVGLGDYLRDVAALRAMGLTPAQVTVSLVTRTGVLALAAVAAGAGAGYAASAWLVNLAGQIYGIGAGLGAPPPAGATLAVAAGALVAAAATAALPARRMARMPVARALAP
jgi:putative ABC transport system permease protein